MYKKLSGGSKTGAIFQSYEELDSKVRYNRDSVPRCPTELSREGDFYFSTKYPFHLFIA